METKTCKGCGETKPLEAFSFQWGKPRARCRDCYARNQRALRAAKHGLTLSQWDEQQRQEGEARAAPTRTCKACGQTLPLDAFEAIGNRPLWTCRKCGAMQERAKRAAESPRERERRRRRRQLREKERERLRSAN